MHRVIEKGGYHDPRFRGSAQAQQVRVKLGQDQRVPSERERLRALADESAHSRIFAGIHYRFDGEAGLDLGRRVARQALAFDPHGHGPFPMR